MPLDGSNVEQEFEALTGKVKGFADETKGFAERAQKEIKAFGALSEETKRQADEALLKLGETNARLGEIEQKMARRGKGDEPAELKTLGEHVTSNERIAAMNSGTRGSMSLRIETKDILNATATVGAGTSPTNSLVIADRKGFSPLAQRRLTVRDLIAPGETTSNAIEYVTEVSFTNSAAPVAEGALKPKSDVTFNLVNAPVRTIAHYVKASRQVLDDAAQLRSIIDQRLRYGLAFQEEAQLLSGSGTGANIKGIITSATAYSAPFVMTTPTLMDQLRLAILQATVAEYPPSGIVLNHIDWAKIELLKDTQGRYITGDAQGVMTPTLWGLPVVATNAMTAGTYLAGAFRSAAQIFDRMSVEVLVSTENEDDFIKNMVTIRCEERLALAVYRAAAFITGTFT
jgi:HK97 family phage major capsid protein